jgi:hypothetical protein
MSRTKGTPMKRKLTLATAVGALVLALSVVLAACGGNSGDSGSSSGAADAEERHQAELEYARCMREHGVDLPDPVNGRFELRQRAGDQQKVQDAQEACREILEKVGPPPLDEEQEAELREAMLDFAKCMREHGVDMPDPKFEEGGGVTQLMPPGSEDDADVEEAQKACQPILDAAQPDGPAAGGGDS